MTSSATAGPVRKTRPRGIPHQTDVRTFCHADRTNPRNLQGSYPVGCSVDYRRSTPPRPAVGGPGPTAWWLPHQNVEIAGRRGVRRADRHSPHIRRQRPPNRRFADRDNPAASGMLAASRVCRRAGRHIRRFRSLSIRQQAGPVVAGTARRIPDRASSRAQASGREGRSRRFSCSHRHPPSIERSRVLFTICPTPPAGEGPP